MSENFHGECSIIFDAHVTRLDSQMASGFAGTRVLSLGTGGDALGERGSSFDNGKFLMPQETRRLLWNLCTLLVESETFVLRIFFLGRDRKPQMNFTLPASLRFIFFFLLFFLPLPGFPWSAAFSRAISSWNSRSSASLGSSLIFGLFLMFFALFAYLSKLITILNTRSRQLVKLFEAKNMSR